MERELTHDEAAELLGAYALDAVEVAERDAIEHHLNECPRCRAEVADHRTVASFLGSAGGRAPDLKVLPIVSPVCVPQCFLALTLQASVRANSINTLTRPTWTRPGWGHAGRVDGGP